MACRSPWAFCGFHPQFTVHPIAFLKVDQQETIHRIGPCLRHGRSFLSAVVVMAPALFGPGPRAPPDNQSWPLHQPYTILLQRYGCGSHLAKKCACQNVRVKGPEDRLKFQIPVQMRKGYARCLGRGRSEADDGSTSKHLGQCVNALRC